MRRSALATIVPTGALEEAQSLVSSPDACACAHCSDFSAPYEGFFVARASGNVYTQLLPVLQTGQGRSVSGCATSKVCTQNHCAYLPSPRPESWACRSGRSSQNYTGCCRCDWLVRAPSIKRLGLTFHIAKASMQTRSSPIEHMSLWVGLPWWYFFCLKLHYGYPSLRIWPKAMRRSPLGPYPGGHLEQLANTQ